MKPRRPPFANPRLRFIASSKGPTNRSSKESFSKPPDCPSENQEKAERRGSWWQRCYGCLIMWKMLGTGWQRAG